MKYNMLMSKLFELAEAGLVKEGHVRIEGTENTHESNLELGKKFVRYMMKKHNLELNHDIARRQGNLVVLTDRGMSKFKKKN